MSEPNTAIRPNANVVLALLLLAYIFNFLDRTILSILAGPIIKDLKLTDTQFGILSGPPFAMLYSVLGIPFAYLADKTYRSRVIAAALAGWSGFTALCGTAVAFWQLFAFRMGRSRSSRSASPLAAPPAQSSAPTLRLGSTGAPRSSPWASPDYCSRR